MMNFNASQKGKGIVCKILKYVSYLIAAIVLLSIATLIFQIFANGSKALSWQFLFGEYDVLNDAPSLKPSLITTGYLMLITLVIAVPLGIACAIYLHEYTKKGNKFVGIVRTALDILAGIPSIIFALFGVLFFCVMLSFGNSILAGALTMVLVVLPPIVRSVEESLKSVPDSYREGSLALGAGRIRTVRKVVLPNALPGIINAVIISMGRVVGESAVILLTLGGVFNNVPSGIMSPGSSLATTLYQFANTAFKPQAYATGIVLIVIVFVLNVSAYLVEYAFSRKRKDR